MAQDSTPRAVSLADFEVRARSRLAEEEFDHIAGGACDEITLEENLASFRKIWLLPRVLRDVTARDSSVTVLGQKISFPVILGPVACLRRFHPEGELAAARAAGGAGTIHVLSTGCCYSLEEVARAALGPLWFQLYAYRDRGITKALIERAESAGYAAICLTVDVPVAGKKERDLRNNYIYPAELLYKSMANTGFTAQELDSQVDRLPAFAAEALTVSLTWDYLAWLQSITRLPFLLKGVLSAEDAARAATHGIKGIVVSNHGGRQLDGTPSPINVLPEIFEAVEGRAEIFLDSGIRRGTDVLKALALGAKAVLLGRPYVWALAAAGQDGVCQALDILRNEFDNAMALTGCSRVSDINRSLIRR